jgi:uncharacterized protein YkwD
MLKIIISILISVLLVGCAPQEIQMAPDGKPVPKIYDIKAHTTAQIQFRMLDAVNVLRSSRSLTSLQLNAQLNAAAATHSRDMSVQNRPWHFGSDGSSPLDRAAMVGYEKVFLGETISETYESEITTLTAWINSDSTREVILDPRANDLGFAWFQEPNGKIWWTMLLGGNSLSTVQ